MSECPADLPLQFITIEEATVLLRVSKSWIYKAVEGRKIPFTKLGNRIIFDVDELTEWIHAKSNSPQS